MTDEDPAFFKEMKVAIWGMGLMGSSLALALRGSCRQVAGIDADPRVVEYILGREIVDRASTDPAEILADADLIVLATPVGTIIRLLQSLPGLKPSPAVVMDLGSTKTDILAAMASLPERFEPIGSHPMCGKEKLGADQADPVLFTGNPFVLVPLERTTDHALQTGQALIEAVGGQMLQLDAATHDAWVACTSHLPYLIANALAYSTPAEAAPLARSGWQSTARVARTSTSMMMDILATNRSNILAALHRCQAALSDIEVMLLAEEYTVLKARLDSGTEQYLTILNQG